MPSGAKAPISGLFSAAGLKRLRKKPSCCHPEEPKATKDLRSLLKEQLRRFFASLRMTEFRCFSAACSTPPLLSRGSYRALAPEARWLQCLKALPNLQPWSAGLKLRPSEVHLKLCLLYLPSTSVALPTCVYLFAMHQSVVAPTFRPASADLKASATVGAFA